MSKEKSPEVKVFEVSTIKKFVKLMDDHGLTEVDLQQADQKIRLCKRDPVVAAAPVAAPVATPQPSVAAPATSAGAEDDANIVTIDSPMVGTFYSKSKPDSPDYVKVGDSVTPDTCVCLLEAMKTFNELPAGVSGKIVAVLVKNEEAVDVNKPLFKVDTSA
ncbi:MAG: acetyl-CoA carboxylase biotin carboxyl carrier protein [Planctomycetota bacterium]|jgi:acetyl-CoA carboxylase biotin carboxyl carrier protein|nr:acetyl-CoA carboxylase biotin carboxyl carrier protein [Planctomycetota bacterium]